MSQDVMSIITIKTADKGFVVGKKAFTLIELLVVIAIIALMLGILLPSLSLVKKYAKATVCGTNLRRLGVSLGLYAQDNRDFYPRTLPLAPGKNHLIRSDWGEPWPSTICPMQWQAGYPSLLAPYLTDVRIANPYDYTSLPSQMGDYYKDFFKCPGNRIPRSDTDSRKCGFPLDYGLHNFASQNRQMDRPLQSAFLAADQTWGLAYVSNASEPGPNKEPELHGWWNPFVHPNENINVLFPDFSVDRLSKEMFIVQFKTANPPSDKL